jgi:hypothetical protein
MFWRGPVSNPSPAARVFGHEKAACFLRGIYVTLLKHSLIFESIPIGHQSPRSGPVLDAGKTNQVETEHRAPLMQ